MSGDRGNHVRVRGTVVVGVMVWLNDNTGITEIMSAASFSLCLRASRETLVGGAVQCGWVIIGVGIHVLCGVRCRRVIIGNIMLETSVGVLGRKPRQRWM